MASKSREVYCRNPEMYGRGFPPKCHAFGAGSAGCVLANRLSEDDHKSVLLLEAGGDERGNVDIQQPDGFYRLQLTDVNWNYKTVPQKSLCKGFNDQVLLYPRGKVLGGSSCLNYMAYMRGSPHDFDQWEKMGCDGWGYKHVLPYFLKSENCLDDTLVQNGFHSRGGLLTVTTENPTPLTDMFLDACRELGFSAKDCNSADAEGFMLGQKTCVDGVRVSTASAFLRPARTRGNLHICVNAQVTKIILDGCTATGVEFLQQGQRSEVTARLEVIVSGGAIGSAQLLMLSGIGPREHLHSHEIPVTQDLPVGSLLQDHWITWGMEFVTDPALFEQGEVTSSHGYIRTRLADPASPGPDIQFTLMSSTLGGRGPDVQPTMGITNEVWDAMFAPSDKGFGIMVTLSHPKSRGTVRLASRDPLNQPLIDPNNNVYADDVKVQREGIKVILNMSTSNAFKSVGAKLIQGKIPGFEGALYSDDYCDYLIRHMTQAVYHPVGTCRMGKEDDPSTVVDARLRVKGTRKLRVVDASVIPEVTSGNLNAPVIMVAEKAADLIKSDHKSSQ